MNNKAEVSPNNHEWGLYHHREITVLPCIPADLPSAARAMRSIAPSIVGLTLAVNLASLQRWLSSLQTLQVLSQAKKIRTGGYRKKCITMI